jgi:uncharacterized damage-inducible protein DinB
MKELLHHLFSYNDSANTALLTAILQLPDRAEAIAMFTHMIYAQDRWFGRMDATRQEEAFNWAGTPVSEDELLNEWKRSVGQWLGILANSTDERLEEEVLFTRAADGQRLAVKIRDMALHLNFHSVHHRAQINKIISAQGMTVPATDYILGALRVVE